METVLVTPGQRLGHITEFECGPGTYCRKQEIFASLLGERHIVNVEGGVSRISVESYRASPASRVVQVGDIVTGRVTKIDTRSVCIDIFCIGGISLPEVHKAVIRKEDVRELDVDRVDIYEMYRPGDVVRAKVISLGTSREYYLSTASAELGVVMATSAAGVSMVPLSWQEMQCPETKLKEKRKVAKLV